MKGEEEVSRCLILDMEDLHFSFTHTHRGMDSLSLFLSHQRERKLLNHPNIFHSNLTQRHRPLLWARWEETKDGKGDSGVKEEFNSLVLRSAGIRGDLDKIFSLLGLLCVGRMREETGKQME